MHNVGEEVELAAQTHVQRHELALARADRRRLDDALDAHAVVVADLRHDVGQLLRASVVDLTTNNGPFELF